MIIWNSFGAKSIITIFIVFNRREPSIAFNRREPLIEKKLEEWNKSEKEVQNDRSLGKDWWNLSMRYIFLIYFK